MTLDILIPTYNEEGCIIEFINRIIVLKLRMSEIEINCIFINDGSKDNSLTILKQEANRHNFIKVIDLSRNFGHQIAVTAGLDSSNADYVVIIDADLQDPPELIEELLLKVSEGYDIVYAQRKKRDGETFFKLFAAKLFYKLIRKLCKIDIPEDTGDFRLITNRALKAVKQMPERHRFLRGMFPWMGFKSTAVFYNRNERFAGSTSYPFKKMVNFALDAIFSFSNTPLRVATYVGLWVVFFGVLIGCLVVYLKLFTDLTIPGITGVLLTIIIIGGMQIFMLGLIGEYVGRIFEESKNRPLYFVNDKINFEENE